MNRAAKKYILASSFDGKFLDEVMVVGHYRRPSIDFGAMASHAVSCATRQQGIRFDMFNMLYHILNYKKYKRRKKVKKILEEY